MSEVPVGVSVTVVGTCSPDFGCTCEHHSICGTNVHFDMVVRFKMAVVLDGKSSLVARLTFQQILTIIPLLSSDFNQYKSICAVYWVTEAAERCMGCRGIQAFFPSDSGTSGSSCHHFPLLRLQIEDGVFCEK